AAFTNKDSYQKEVKVAASQKTTLKYCFLILDPCCNMPLKAAFTNKDSYQKEVKVSASQKATLSCEVSDLKTDVKWFKDGKQLSSSKTVHMDSKGKSRQLVLENVEKKNAGEYTCEVGNEKLLFKIQVKGDVREL
uniref:Ig-like domain-containing protein n=1 Tax=Sinocyclocheilus grahami TaxID=75366 RepID=A0A672L8P7_SINGR